jgi:hypothetical protein
MGKAHRWGTLPKCRLLSNCLIVGLWEWSPRERGGGTLHIMFISCFTMGKAHMQGTFPKRGAGLKLPPHPWAQPQWVFPRCGGWTQLLPQTSPRGDIPKMQGCTQLSPHPRPCISGMPPPWCLILHKSKHIVWCTSEIGINLKHKSHLFTFISSTSAWWSLYNLHIMTIYILCGCDYVTTRSFPFLIGWHC